MKDGEAMNTKLLSSQLTKEQELVLLLANFRSPEEDSIRELFKSTLNWIELFGYLGYYRTAGLAYYILENCVSFEEEINGDFLLNLYVIYEAQKIRTLAFQNHIKEISDKFISRGISHAFLKGSILTNSIYPLGCRTSNDIDILVSPSDLTECGKILKGLGFIQGFHNLNENKIVPATRQEIINHRINYGEIVPFVKLINEPVLKSIQIDINFSLNEVALQTKEAVENFLKQEYFVYIDGIHKIRTLPPEFFLAHVCVHLFKEATVLEWVYGQRDLSFYKFVDIFALATDNQFKIDWDRLANIACKNRIGKECFYVLYYATLFFQQLKEKKGFNDALNSLKPDSLSYLDEVFDPKNSSVKYRWTIDLFSRFFNLKRIEYLEQIPTNTGSGD